MILNPIRRRRSNKVATEIAAAAIDFAAISFDTMVDEADRFTCQQVDAFVALIAAMGWPPEYRDKLVDAHAAGCGDEP